MTVTETNHLPAALITPPTLPSYLSDADTARREADLRALPLQRIIAYGMELGDAMLLRSLVENGADWTEAGEALAERALALLADPATAPTPATRRVSLQRASACLRLSQIVLYRDDQRRKAIFQRSTELFEQSVAHDPRYTRLHIPHPKGALHGWWIRAVPAPRGGAATVLVVGGMEGWADDHHEAAAVLLERGLDVVLIDGPGQGITRMSNGHYLDDAFAAAYQTVIDHMVGELGITHPIGLWGNSMGGNLVMHVASADPRVAACVNNGGGAQLAKLVSRRRTFEKMECMCGPVDSGADQDVDRVVAATALDESNVTLRCPLLVVHAGEDQLIAREDMTVLYDLAPSDDKTLCTFEDAEHCVYRHPAEKYAVITDWLHSRLAGSGALPGL